jgi:DNA invertase Pin-like site-specific DNA recombinase
MQTAVPYYRVSTERQGISGLGLEAQQKAVQDYAAANNLSLQPHYIEIESGRKTKRPVLDAALQHCRDTGALLLIAKLDRLGRNVAFISRLMEARVDFVAVDNPHANKLMLHIMAAFAEHERDQISLRTIAALQAAKARGIILGAHGKNILAVQNKNASLVFALGLRSLISNLQRKGFTTVRSLQHQLNRRKIPTFHGGTAHWHINTVHRLLKQLEQTD